MRGGSQNGVSQARRVGRRVEESSKKQKKVKNIEQKKGVGEKPAPPRRPIWSLSKSVCSLNLSVLRCCCVRFFFLVSNEE